jgi:hypothetical protein
MISVRVAEVTAVFCDSLISTLTPSPSQGCGTIPEGINLDEIRAKAAALRAIGDDQERLEELLDHISEFVEDLDDGHPHASAKNPKKETKEQKEARELRESKETPAERAAREKREEHEEHHGTGKQPTMRPRESP